MEWGHPISHKFRWSHIFFLFSPFSFLSLLRLQFRVFFFFKFLYLLSFLWNVVITDWGWRCSSDTVRGGDWFRDRRDPPPFHVVQYIKRYGDRVVVQRFSAISLAVDLPNCLMSTLGACVTLLLAPGLNDGDTEMDVGRLTRCVISARWTVHKPVLFKNSGTRDHLATFRDG